VRGSVSTLPIARLVARTDARSSYTQWEPGMTGIQAQVVTIASSVLYRRAITLHIAPPTYNPYMNVTSPHPCLYKYVMVY